MANNKWAILDLRGTVLHSYFAGMTAEPLMGSIKDRINTAEYGFQTWLNMYYDLVVNTIGSPIHMIAVLDAGNQYRKGLYPDYKKRRGEVVSDPIESEQKERCMALVKNFLASQGVPLVKLSGQEADDVIAYLCQKLKGPKVVYTKDNDLVALAREDVHIMVSLIDTQDMKGIPPSCVTVYKSLVGDTSDEYGGVKGFGPKAWESLVEDFGFDGMEQLTELLRKGEKTTLRAMAEITPNKAFKKAVEAYDDWQLMFKIASLNPSLCEGAKVKLDWYKRAPTLERLTKALTDGACLDLLDRYKGDVYEAILVTKANLQEAFDLILRETPNTLFVGWDYETTDTVKNPRYKEAANGREYVSMLDSKVTGCSFAIGRNANKVLYLSVGHKDTDNVDAETVLAVIKHFEDEGVDMVAQNCLPGDTEVLTRDGWRRIDEAASQDEIMQWDSETGELQFVKPLGKTESFSETLLEWDSQFHKGAYTPEHRIYFKTGAESEWLVDTADGVSGRHGNSVWLPLSGSFKGNPVELDMSDYEVRFMEAVRADGHFSGQSCHCRFHLRKERKVVRLRHLLDTLGLSYSESIGKDGCWSIGVAACPLLRQIQELLGDEKSYGMWLLDLSYENRRVLLSEVVHWDGHSGNNGNLRFSTTCRETEEALQLAAHLSDYRWSGSFKPNNKPHWKPLFNGTVRDTSHCKLGARNEKPTVVNWNKPVYCFTVPSGAFMVRRKGSVFITGNCMFEGTITKVNFGHDLKFYSDTKLYAHHIDENESCGLKDLSKRYLNYDQVSYKKTLESAGAKDMSEISGLDVLSYGADDSLVTGHLYQFFQILTQLEGTYDFIREYECPAVAPLVQAHIDGVVLDTDSMDRQRAADEETVETKMKLIRSLLEQYATKPDYDAIESLYKDQEAYIGYKAKLRLLEKTPDSSPSDIQVAIKAACADYKLKLKQNSFYRPLVSSVVFKEFIPTTAMFTKVAVSLGLPPFEKDTKIYRSDYVTDNRSAEGVQGEFITLLSLAMNQVSKREGEHYEALKAFCDKILKAEGKEVFEGTELNFGSPVQNQYLFYLLLGLPIRKRTKVMKDSTRDKGGFEGAPATDESAIEFALANDCEDHPWKAELLHALLEYKAAATRISIYWTPYPLWIGEDKVMHPGFSSCGTVTRRPTGTNPNLLQVSKGPVREIFVPRSPENMIVSIDFSSEELRVLASMCLDPTFLSAYTGPVDKDLHSLTACGLLPMFLHKFPDVSKDQVVFETDKLVSYDWYVKARKEPTDLGHILDKVRGYGKTANFGVGYGAGPDTISAQLMIPLAEAEIIVEAMNTTYPGIGIWKTRLYEKARLTGYVETAWGSRRHIGTGLMSGTRREIGRWERQASNFVIQATCADLLKVALVSLWRRETLKKFGAYLIAAIYDELLFEVPIRNLHGFLLAASDDMEQEIPGLIVPMKADCSFGPSWGEQYEVGVRPSRETIEATLALIGENRDSKAAG
jgi:DNA polymerase I-like protein with 3'-5' exonuclease and polymerase domains/5'-3' exonuclease